MRRSHTTQLLQNYYDAKDRRVRELPYTLDAQLLNMAAESLDGLNQKLDRETSASFLANNPVHLDNRGVWYGIRVDNDFSADTMSVVTGTKAGVASPLVPFDDTVMVPASIEVEPSLEPIAFTNPVLFSLQGSGDTISQAWSVLYVTPGTLPFPNQLTFWIDSSGYSDLAIEILIEGERYPRPAWASQRRKTSEIVQVRLQGMTQSLFSWEIVDRVTVRGLPLGATLTGYAMPFQLPAVLDQERPASLSGYRDVSFPRYFQIASADSRLNEMYMPGNLGGLEVLETRLAHAPFTDVALIPKTWSLVACAGTKLYFMDRRPSMPDQLAATALTQEPLFGLDVEYDITKPGPMTFVEISAVPYARSTSLIQSRYLLQTPSGDLYALLPDGGLAPYSGGAGWRRGMPGTLSIPLDQTGTYVITLECLDSDGTLSYDSFPYPNLTTAMDAIEIDIASLLPEARGVAFDSRNQLWAWTGDYMVPLRIAQHAYLYDAPSRMLYVTAPFDQIDYE